MRPEFRTTVWRHSLDPPDEYCGWCGVMYGDCDHCEECGQEQDDCTCNDEPPEGCGKWGCKDCYPDEEVSE